jgi:hypothetical protein
VGDTCCATEALPREVPPDFQGLSGTERLGAGAGAEAGVDGAALGWRSPSRAGREAAATGVVRKGKRGGQRFSHLTGRAPSGIL